jgi:uncharacterized membrane protein
MEILEQEPQLVKEFVATQVQRPMMTMDRTVRWGVAFFAACVLVVAGHLLLKCGVNLASASVHGGSLINKLAAFGLQPLVIEGLLIYGLGSAFWIIAVAQADISVLYPLSSINYVLVCLFSITLFNEQISFRRGAGVTVIALGMILLTRKSWQVSR